MKFEKYGFKVNDFFDGEWYKGDLLIYEGLGFGEEQKISVALYTLCKKEDVGDVSKIIFRGEYDEMENYLKKINREKKLNGLI
jgi:hypothetical protein